MFSEQNYVVLTFVLYIHLFLASVWKLHVFYYALFVCFIYCIEETTSVEKSSIILFGINSVLP